MKSLFGIAFAAAVLAAGTANAAIISQHFNIKASNFQLYFGGAGQSPVDPVTIDFDVTFDNSSLLDHMTSGLRVNSFNLPYAVEFAYDPSWDFLVVATSAVSYGCQNPKDSFCIFIINASGASARTDFFNQIVSDGGSYLASTRVTSVRAAPVPEPASWALMLSGFGAIGGALRSRRKVAVSFG